MPEMIVKTTEIKRLEILDKAGNVDLQLMPPLSDDDIRKMYELIVFCRIFDRRALNLQREGRLGTYASILGQEASQIGSALAIQNNDWIFPSFREMGVYLTLGYPPYKLFQYWGGDERGISPPEGLNIFPVCVPVGTQVPHASGAAFSAKFKRENIAVISYFGDGGTSEGDFHEGLNMAGVFKLPVVFICQNNQWAISVRRERQTASGSLAQKAVAYGFAGTQVDGNDIFAVYKASKEALEKARNGEGPSLIECETYRMSDHTTADDASRYRTKEEVVAWEPKDPLLRLRLYMEKKGIWSNEYHEKAEARAKEVVDDAVHKAESIAPASPKDMFAFTSSELSSRMKRQMDGL